MLTTAVHAYYYHIQGVFSVNEDDFASRVATSTRQLSRHCSGTFNCHIYYTRCFIKNNPYDFLYLCQTADNCRQDNTAITIGNVLSFTTIFFCVHNIYSLQTTIECQELKPCVVSQYLNNITSPVTIML